LAIPRAGEFIDLLVASKVGLVVDVSTIPRSRTNPQYNREALPGSLSGFQIALSMSRSLAVVARAKNIAPEVNAFWENQSFHNYADYAMGGGFSSGLARLRELGAVTRMNCGCARRAAVPSAHDPKRPFGCRKVCSIADIVRGREQRRIPA
jgi:Protein of unknown function, DUF488